MQVIIPNGGQRNPLCLRAETRAYRSWADLRRARAQITDRTVEFLEVNGPALMISRYAHGPAVPR